MKKLILITSLLLFIGVNITFAQTPAPEEAKKGTSQTYVSKGAVLSKYHNEVELEKLGKIELTKLYMERVSILTEVIPYLALSKKPAGATLIELGIPDTKSNISHLEKEVKNKIAYLEAVSETLNDIIPYADKGNIIWTILFMEETIHRVEKALGEK